MTPFDFVNSVSSTKKDLTKDDPYAIKAYVSYIVNKALSYHLDSLLHANDMNLAAHLPAELQYRFFLNTLRKARRISKWAKPEQTEQLALVQQFFGLSREKAITALALLSDKQLKYIKTKVVARGESNDSARKHD